ncbi:MAG: hypothetical protein HGA37_14430 [Lentimicrobium sp.]|nr:hypothetical protein [Lentimicrobium sp.]
MKTALAIFILLHGIIHFLGFTKAFNLAPVDQLKQPISITSGFFWLLAGLLFLAAVLLVFLKADWWWIPALIAIVISQFLIILSWQDARFGTIANIIILIAVVAGFGAWNFHRSFINDYSNGLARTQSISTTLLTEADIQHLPLPVQRYLRYTGVLNREKVNNMKITFTGQMREKGKDWFELHSTQYNFFDIPTRLFYMTGKMKGLTIPGYHSYKNGIAGMQVKLFGLIPVVNVSEGELNQAETVTVFNDMCLMAPASLIDKRIQWKESDSLSSKATFTCNGITITAILYFNKVGQLVNFVSDDRYAISGKSLKRYRFSTPVREYKNINGLNLCSLGEVVWHYPDGEFVYGRFILESVEYNVGPGK